MLEIKHLPDVAGALDIDKTELRRSLIEGLFEEPVETENGSRIFYTYIKPGILYNRPCIIVAVPECEDLQMRRRTGRMPARGAGEG